MAYKKNKIDGLLKFRLGLRTRIGIYKRLKSFTEEEFPVYDSLVKFKLRYDKKKDFRGKIITIWLENMKHGQSFTDSIKGWVPESELNLIAAGEEGAGIEKGLGEAIKFAESAQKIKNTIIGGGTYPAVLLIVVLGFVAMFSIKLAPTYLAILPVERWPDLGRNFYGVSKALVDYWYILLGIFIGSSILIGMTISTWVGNTRDFFDKLPPWSVYKVYQASAFLISLASMMQSGTPLNDALKRIKNTTSPWVGQYMDEMIKNLRRGGKNFGQHLDVGLLDEETAGDVIDYSELGKFEEAIYSIGEASLEESVRKIESRMAVVRTIMIALVGITVGIIYYTSIELNTTVAEAASSSTMSTIKK
jgi:type II secretory pathway component PulF